MSAENTEKLTFVSLKLCFLGFVHRHNELFFSYLWSFVHKFTSSSMNPIVSWWGKNAHTLFNYNRFKAEFCLCWGVCVQTNIFVARVLHFSAFIYCIKILALACMIIVCTIISHFHWINLANSIILASNSMNGATSVWPVSSGTSKASLDDIFPCTFKPTPGMMCEQF